MNTNGDAAPTPPRAAGGRSTPGLPLLDSGIGWRLAAAIAAMVAFACSIFGDVPIASPVTLVALLPAVLVDVVEERLPNRPIAGAALCGLTIVFAGAVGADSNGLGEQLSWLGLGAAAMACPLLILHLIAPGAMGFGDVKAAAVAGAAVGLVDPVLGLVALVIGSGGSAIAGLATQRRTIAFGPGIVGGAIVALALSVSPLDPLDIRPQPATEVTQRVST